MPVVTITGGTGKFKNARGHLVVKSVGNSNSNTNDVTITLTRL